MGYVCVSVCVCVYRMGETRNPRSRLAADVHLDDGVEYVRMKINMDFIVTNFEVRKCFGINQVWGRWRAFVILMLILRISLPEVYKFRYLIVYYIIEISLEWFSSAPVVTRRNYLYWQWRRCTSHFTEFWKQKSYQLSCTDSLVDKSAIFAHCTRINSLL
jgi:hypothetical protein